MTNAERQRRFQEAHPGYDARRKRRERAGIKRAMDRMKAELQAAAAAERAAAAEAEQLALPAPAEVAPTPRVLLALPAPAVVPVLPGLNFIAPTTEPQRASVPVERSIAA